MQCTIAGHFKQRHITKMHKTVTQLMILAGAALFLSACNLVDKGGSEIGGVGCSWSSGTPGTPEYKRCRSRNAHEGVLPTRGIGGGVGE